jgi:hypothetical protein
MAGVARDEFAGGENAAMILAAESRQPMLSLGARLARGVLRRAFHRHVGRHRKDAAIDPNREEARPARVATVRFKTDDPLEPKKHSVIHPLARNPLHVHLSAFWAMHVKRISDRNFPGEEAEFASPAAPRPQNENTAK